MSSVRRILLILLPVLAAPALAALPLSPRAPSVQDACVDCVPGEILVQFKSGTSRLERESALGQAAGTQLQSLRSPALAKSLVAEAELVRARVSLSVPEALERLRRDPSVAFAEPVARIHAAAVANDTYYVTGTQWGAFSSDSPTATGPAGTTNAYGAGAESAWARGYTGGNTLVGVLDEGVATLHPEIDTACWRNTYEYADGRDNDGNGYVDDLNGWDFVNNDNSVYDGGTTGATDRHGTAVAGVIGAEGGNGAGIAGVCWHVNMIPVKVLSNGTGTTAGAVAALNYLCDLRSRLGFRVVAVNCAWSTSVYSQALHDALLRCARAGILIVAAAGNTGSNIDSVPSYPACIDTRVGTSTQAAATFDAVIGVAALDSNGNMPAWSSYGARNVELAAPGAGIVTLSPPSGYTITDGTSLAAAHVTGALALFASVSPASTAAEIRNAIVTSATATPSLSGRVATNGRLNVGGAFGALVIHDVAVTALSVPTAVAQNRTLTLSVTVQNQGTQAESASVVFSDMPPSGGRAGTLSLPAPVTLAAGASTTVLATWNTTNTSEGTHVITAQLRPIPGEQDTADNARSAYSTVTVTTTPAIQSLSPASMRGGQTVFVTITGSGFTTGATIAFAGGTGPLPSASNVVVAADSRSITMGVTAAATTTTGAPWDVTVTNPDGRAGRLLDAFTVTP